MNAYLFGWNPVKFKWENLDDDIQTLKVDGKLVDNWSVVSHKNIKPGDRAYIVRLGAEPKGIFASGTIASLPYPTVKKGRNYYRVDIALDVLLNPVKEPILTFAILKIGILAEQTWSPQASGISIRPYLADELESVWLNFLSRHAYYGKM